MAPQTSISRLANVLGTIGTVCWCIQLCPQIWRNWRTRSTEGLPAMSMYLWLVSAVPFGVYAIVQNFNIPLQVQPQCFCLLCGISWLQCLIFGRQWRTRIAILLFLALIPLYITLQIGLVLAIRPAYARGVEWPVYLTGISAFVLMICGYLLILFEPIKRRGRVVGIDFIFLGVDWAGAFFSLLSLVAQGRFDIMFGILYAMCCIVDMGIAASHVVWLVRTRKLRGVAKAVGMTFDSSPECMAWQARAMDPGAPSTLEP